MLFAFSADMAQPEPVDLPGLLRGLSTQLAAASDTAQHVQNQLEAAAKEKSATEGRNQELEDRCRELENRYRELQGHYQKLKDRFLKLANYCMVMHQNWQLVKPAVDSVEAAETLIMLMRQPAAVDAPAPAPGTTVTATVAADKATAPGDDCTIDT